MNRSLDYRVSLVAIAAIVAVNAVPWFIEPFTLLVSDPLLALRLLVGRLVLVGLGVGLFIAVRRYGWISVALFFLNPMLAAGWLRARGWYAEKTAETARPKPATSQRRIPEPEPSAMPAIAAPNPARMTPEADPVVSPKRAKRTVRDLGPPKRDRFRDSPISSRRRGLFS